MIAIPNRSKPVFCGHCRLVELRGGGSWQLICSITRTPIAREEMNDDCPLIEIVTCGECKHRDPEDKKCDCGMFERQRCIFPVADDYFCKYGERRADEID